MFKKAVYQAGVSEEARETHRTCGPFAFWNIFGERKRFSSHSDIRGVLVRMRSV
jgi:hypothetical protein